MTADEHKILFVGLEPIVSLCAMTISKVGYCFWKD